MQIGAARRSAPPFRPSQDLILLGRLQDAEDDHDRERRAAYAGTTQASLDADKALWSQIGGAIASLARLIAANRAASAYCPPHAEVGRLAARLSEAIDDELDPPAWRVVDAVAACEAARP